MTEQQQVPGGVTISPNLKKTSVILNKDGTITERPSLYTPKPKPKEEDKK